MFYFKCLTAYMMSPSSLVGLFSVFVQWRFDVTISHLCDLLDKDWHLNEPSCFNCKVSTEKSPPPKKKQKQPTTL